MDLTDAEIDVLRLQSTSEEIRAHLARQHESLGTRVSAYQKVGALARAEREALIEIRALNIVKGAAASSDAAERRLATLRHENNELLQTVAHQKQKIAALIAQPALATHSEATR